MKGGIYRGVVGAQETLWRKGLRKFAEVFCMVILEFTLQITECVSRIKDLG